MHTPADPSKLDIRKPAVAGTFYPANPVELTKTIARLFSEVDKVQLDGRALGLIAPHAGYPYSGRVAAKAYKTIEGADYDTVVVVSPSHTVFFKGSSVYNGRGYETPIGVIETDRPLAEKIAAINPSAVYLSSQGHSVGATRGEHALEVQLPFLQIVLGKFKLVAIVMGDQEPASIRQLGQALGTALKGTNSLLVASTDLSHFYNEQKARRLDYAIQTAIEKYDPDLLLATVENGRGEACGSGPVGAVMIASRGLGGKTVQFLDYTTSASATGDFDEVVGYLSAAIVQGAEERVSAPAIGQRPAPKPFELTDDHKAQLHRIAREAILAKLENREYAPEYSEELDIKRGLFVTIKLQGELRGCIGQIRGRDPLPVAVAEMAVAAAFEDPRFVPISRADYDKLEYEISVLSPLERVRLPKEIEVGVHGLMVKLDLHTGLLLPQVASEHRWDVVTFLEQTCLKAGLPKNGYKDKSAELYRFSADVF